MYANLRGLHRRHIRAVDGYAGAFSQALFDDRAWEIRHFVVDLDDGGDSPVRSVLVPPDAVAAMKDETGSILLTIDGGSVRESPGVEAHMPVCMRKERDFHITLRNKAAFRSALGTVSADPPVPADGDGEETDAHLRSSYELIGYGLWGRDGKVGIVSDFIFDDASWRIPYIVTRLTRPPLQKRVLVTSPCVTEIDWGRRAVRVASPSGIIMAAPGFDSAGTMTHRYESTVISHYGSPPCGDL